MNRILFEKSEISDGRVTFGGVRAEHVLTVLHGEVGQTLKTGEVDGLIGTSEIVEIGQGERSRSTEVEALGQGERSRSTVDSVTVKVNHTERSMSPWIDLILAPPRPRVMKRLLPQLAALGVGRIFLVGAKKVEKDFWGATLLKEENYRPLLIDGLMQAGTSILPTLEIRRNFRKFVTDELDALPSASRLVAHPYANTLLHRDAIETIASTKSTIAPANRAIASTKSTLDSAKQPDNQTITQAGKLRPLLAIGPEGGWTDDEVALLEQHGFARYSLGPRILRTDTATVALLAQLMPMYDNATTAPEKRQPLTLASGSPRRAKILKEQGVDFVVAKSDAPEVCYPDDPERTVRENALAKGRAVSCAAATQSPNAPCRAGVLSADTIVWFNGKVYGKPKDLDEAKTFLRELSGNVHTVFTGVAFNGDVRVCRSDVKFRDLSDALIDTYVARVKPTDRAGAYDIDESGDLIVESYTGSYENIMGLPLEPLREWGVLPKRISETRKGVVHSA